MMVDVRISSHVNCQMSSWFTFVLVVGKSSSYDSLWKEKTITSGFREQRVPLQINNGALCFVNEGYRPNTFDGAMVLAF